VPNFYQLKFQEHPAYLHAIVTGDNTRENVMRYLNEVLEACQTRGCRQVLIEERLEGPRLGTLDVFEIASTGSERVHDVFQAIAYVDVFAGPQMPFAETVAVNRGIPVRLFATVAEASAWLTQLATGNDAPESSGQ